jgi:tyrosyl-tRNA synthetase
VVRRGLVAQCTDMQALDQALLAGPMTAYIGFDCTAPSLHAGSLVPITLLRLLQESGHRPLVVMGGGTSQVGDPSDKDDMRPLLSREAIAANMAGIRRVIERFLSVGHEPTDALFVDNAEWLDSLLYVPFLREVGRHFTINRMLAFESVRRRLDREQPMTFLEFNYMVLQAYDFVEVAKRHGCLLQMGGSDQWGNILNGVELVRRILDRQAHGLTAPLLATTSGDKMGKTAGGAVWLDPERTTPYDFWQFWRNVADADVIGLLRTFTDLPQGEISRLAELEGQELNVAKKVLATEMTRLCHGAEAAASAQATASATFEHGEVGADLPVLEVPRAELASGVTAGELLRRSGLAASGSEARRLVQSRGARLNDQVVEDAMRLVTLADVTAGGCVKLSAGRKRHVLVRPV